MELLHETLAAEIRGLRDVMHMDQKSLADAIGVSRSAISNIEGGRQLVTLTLFYKIAYAFNKDPGQWLNSLLDKSSAVQSITPDDVNNHDVLDAINDAIKEK